VKGLQRSTLSEALVACLAANYSSSSVSEQNPVDGQYGIQVRKVKRGDNPGDNRKMRHEWLEYLIVEPGAIYWSYLGEEWKRK